MKKTILVILIAIMVTTPCIAQEIKPDELLSLDGTQWEVTPITETHLTGDPPSISFYQDQVYMCSLLLGCYLKNFEIARSFNLAGMSYFQHGTLGNDSTFGCRDIEDMYKGLVSHQVGIGIMHYDRQFWGRGHCNRYDYVAILKKINDNWIPEESILSISPNQGEQGTLLTAVKLVAELTTFQDNLPVEISFYPPDGLTVSNIDVTYNTVIDFDLAIAVDAPIGYRDVIVIYDDDNKILEDDSGFEVLPRSN